MPQRLAILTLLVLASVGTLFTARQARAAAAAGLLPDGTTAPAFTLPSQDTKDKTSGCTLEAHNFQRDQAKFDKLGAAILGVSLDTAESHKSFCTQENLTFKLLADPDHKVVDEYGVPVQAHGDMKFASRVTYLISPAGKVVKVWPDVKVGNHSEDVLAAIEAAKKS